MRVWRRSGADRFCVTGDLVNFALPQEFREATVDLERLCNVAPVSLTPGNHDALVGSDLTELRRHWAKWLVGAGEGSAEGNVHLHGPVAFIGVTSAIPTGPFMAYGTVAPTEISAMEQTLRKLKREGYFRVVMMHHPPQVGAAPWHCGLHGAVPLREALQRAGAELLLHGHLHRPVRSWLAGPDAPIPVFGVGSTSLASNRPGGRRGHFHLFTIQDGPAGRFLEVTDYHHDVRNGEYHPGSPERVGEAV